MLSTAYGRSTPTHIMGEQEGNVKVEEVDLRSVEGTPESELVSAAVTVAAAAAKKKKKKKTKKKGTGENTNASTTATANGKAARGDAHADTKPVGLCFARNKHWRYINSYHVRGFSSRS